MKQTLEILKFLVKIDFREPAKKVRPVKQRLIVSIVVNSLWFFIIGFVISMTSDVSSETEFLNFLFKFSFVVFSIQLLLIISSLLFEFDPILVNRTEIDFFFHLPVNKFSFKIAKLLNFYFYIAVNSVSYNLFSALGMPFTKLNPEFYHTFSTKVAVFAFTMCGLIFNITIANIVASVLLIFGFILKRGSLKKFVMPAQLGSIFLVIFIYQFINKMLSANSETLWIKSDFLAILPQTLYSKSFIYLLGFEKFFTEFAIATTLFPASILILLNFLELKRLFAISEKLSSLDKKAKKKSFPLAIYKKISELLRKNKTEISFYELIYTVINRDKSLKIKFLAIPLMSVAISLYNLLFSERRDALFNPYSNFNILAVMTLLFGVSIAVTSLTSHRESRANWIYNLIEKQAVQYIFAAERSVIIHYLVLPSLLIFLFTQSLIRFDIPQIILSFVLTLFAVIFYFDTAILINRSLPFSEEPVKVSSIEKILFQFLALPYIIIVVIMQKTLFSLLSFIDEAKLVFYLAVVLIAFLGEKLYWKIVVEKLSFKRGCLKEGEL